MIHLAQLLPSLLTLLTGLRQLTNQTRAIARQLGGAATGATQAGRAP